MPGTDKSSVLRPIGQGVFALCAALSNAAIPAMILQPRYLLLVALAAIVLPTALNGGRPPGENSGPKDPHRSRAATTPLRLYLPSPSPEASGSSSSSQPNSNRAPHDQQLICLDRYRRSPITYARHIGHSAMANSRHISTPSDVSNGTIPYGCGTNHSGAASLVVAPSTSTSMRPGLIMRNEAFGGTF